MKLKEWLIVVGTVIAGVFAVIIGVIFGTRKPGVPQDTPEKILENMKKEDERIKELNKKKGDLDEERNRILDDINSSHHG